MKRNFVQDADFMYFTVFVRGGQHLRKAVHLPKLGTSPALFNKLTHNAKYNQHT